MANPKNPTILTTLITGSLDLATCFISNFFLKNVAKQYQIACLLSTKKLAGIKMSVESNYFWS